MAFDLKRITKVGEYRYEIGRAADGSMRVPARLFADEEILRAAASDRSLEQLVNVAWLPGIVGAALAMPDIHEGYGFPIGGIAATSVEDGVVSPGGVGYDINCGVRMLATRLDEGEVAPYLEDLATALYKACPSGVGEKGTLRLSSKELDRVLMRGAGWARERGYATDEDLVHTESSGCLADARVDARPLRSRKRPAASFDVRCDRP